MTGSTAVAALMSPAMPVASIAAVSPGLALRTSGSPLIAVVSVAPAGMGPVMVAVAVSGVRLPRV